MNKASKTHDTDKVSKITITFDLTTEKEDGWAKANLFYAKTQRDLSEIIKTGMVKDYPPVVQAAIAIVAKAFIEYNIKKTMPSEDPAAKNNSLGNSLNLGA
jgi:hypothetical protein